MGLFLSLVISVKTNAPVLSFLSLTELSFSFLTIPACVSVTIRDVSNG